VSEKTLELVGQIYDAVSEPAGWNSFLDNLARAMGAQAARMRMLDRRGNCFSLLAGAGHDSSYDENYHQYYMKVDLWNPILAQCDPGMVFDSSKIVPYDTFKTSEIYNDFYRHYDTFYALGSNIASTDDVIARIGVHRSHSQGTYSEQDAQLLQQLMPHLLRAFKLGSHLETMQSQLSGMQETLYRSPSPLLLIDELGQVAFTNQRAEALLGSESGLAIHNDQLRAVHEAEQSELHRLLQQAVATGARKGTGSGGAMRLTSTDGIKRYNLLITPYPSRSASHLGLNRRICAAVFIHASQQSGKLPADLLKSLYGLTRSELRLAEGIIEGLTPAEAATRYGVSVNTTRSQLRALFAKTDTQRQAELVRLLMGLTS
jgi:DNA-binding CsgD family transcriptional regulator/PAS domain-containing protein